MSVSLSFTTCPGSSPPFYNVGVIDLHSEDVRTGGRITRLHVHPCLGNLQVNRRSSLSLGETPRDDSYWREVGGEELENVRW